MDGMSFTFKINCAQNIDEQCIMSLLSDSDRMSVGVASRRFMWNVAQKDMAGKKPVGLSKDVWIRL